MNWINDAINIAKLSLLIVSPLVLLVVFWYFASKLLKKNRKRVKRPEHIIVAPKQIARRVLYVEELDNLKVNRGDIAFVITEESMYLYDGEEWVKIQNKI